GPGILAIEAAIKLEQFIEPTRHQVEAIGQFFKYLKPISSPYLQKGQLSESAKRGRTLYYNPEKTDCWICHPSPLFSDTKAWNCGVPNITLEDNESSFITPPIMESWRTAPYGHVGNYKEIGEIITLPSHSNKIQQLTTEEIKDLIEYVLSL
ncbi:MAG: hypothetical protein N2053_11360, partial [Chitinispirillaceae bacterium]|nr:hypothetical protein [Chitinispirillaceae bacterium]